MIPALRWSAPDPRNRIDGCNASFPHLFQTTNWNWILLRQMLAPEPVVSRYWAFEALYSAALWLRGLNVT